MRQDIHNLVLFQTISYYFRLPCSPFYIFISILVSTFFLAVWCPAWLMTEAGCSKQTGGTVGSTRLDLIPSTTLHGHIYNQPTLSSNTNNTITTQTRLLGQLTKCLCDPQNPNLVPWQSWGRVSSIIRGKLLSFQLCDFANDSWCMGIAKMLG